MGFLYLALGLAYTVLPALFFMALGLETSEGTAWERLALLLPESSELGREWIESDGGWGCYHRSSAAHTCECDGSARGQDHHGAGTGAEPLRSTLLRWHGSRVGI